MPKQQSNAGTHETNWIVGHHSVWYIYGYNLEMQQWFRVHFFLAPSLIRINWEYVDANKFMMRNYGGWIFMVWQAWKKDSWLREIDFKGVLGNGVITVQEKISAWPFTLWVLFRKGEFHYEKVSFYSEKASHLTKWPFASDLDQSRHMEQELQLTARSSTQSHHFQWIGGQLHHKISESLNKCRSLISVVH